MSVQQVTEIRRVPSGWRCLASVASQVVVGTCFAWGIIGVMLHSAEQSIQTHSLSVRLWIDSGFLLGVSLGILVSSRVSVLALPTVVWVVAMAVALAGTIGFTLMPSTDLLSFLLRLSIGCSTAVAWITCEQVSRDTVPNYARWRWSGILAAAFAGYGIVIAAILSLHQFRDPNVSQVRTILLWPSLCLLLLPVIVFAFRSLGRQPMPAPRTMQTSEPKTAAATSANGAMSANSSGNSCSEKCDQEQCCGGVAQVTETPLWIGLTLAGSGFVLLFGPILSIWQLAIAGSRTGLLWPIWILAAANLLGVIGYRRIMGQAGNTLTLPLFLLITVSFTVAVSLTTVGTLLWLMMSAVAVAAGTGSFHGCLNLVSEYFRDGLSGSRRTSVLSAGAVTAALLILSGSVVDGLIQTAAVYVLQPILAFAASMMALRAVPQPMIVTRFAERFLKHSVPQS